MKYRIRKNVADGWSSPSVWREWIEIFFHFTESIPVCESPSVWREWIEIPSIAY